MGDWFKRSIERQWYSQPTWLYMLLPLWCVFVVVSCARRYAYLRTQKNKINTLNAACSSLSILSDTPTPPTHEASVHQPFSRKVLVCIVGNISVGGTGKTPVIIYLVKLLQQHGLRVGVVSRGYGATQSHGLPIEVIPTTPVEQAGDEPLLIAKQTQCPVVICKDRVLAVKHISAKQPLDIILSDDGMQHYALDRQIELAVIDAARLLGNGYRLPLGPLREPPNRLRAVQFLLVNGKPSQALSDLQRQYHWPDPTFFEVKPRGFIHLKTGKQVALDYFNDHDNLFAVAGIGHPQRFFTTLKQVYSGAFTQHVFADHHAFTFQDFTSLTCYPIIMTEKDAVKCHDFATDAMWYLAIDITLGRPFEAAFIQKIHQLISNAD